MPRRNARYTNQSLTGRCPPAWIQKTRDEVLTTLSTNVGAKAWIAAFLAIVSNHRLTLPNVYVGLIQDGDIGNVDLFDMLYWLDRQLKANRAGIGYANRLSEAGASWGDAAPDSLTEADPLDLVTTLESLGCKVIVIDPDCDPAGTNNLDANSTTGCVRISRSSTTAGVMCIDDTTVKLPTQNQFSGNNIIHKLWLTLADFHERGGGGRRMPLVNAHGIVLIRQSVAQHVVNRENIIGISNLEQQLTSLNWIGYPGEFPEVWCGNSMGVDGGAEDDTTNVGTECPWSDLPVTNGTTVIFYVGFGATKYRDNFNCRNLWFHSKRETAGGDFIYADRLFYLGSGTGASFRFCKFTDSCPIGPADDNAASFPDIVDFGYPARAATPLNNIIYGRRNNIIFDSNLVEPVAVADWPPDSRTTVTDLGHSIALDFGDGAAITGVRFTRNTFRGVKNNIACQFHGSIGSYVAHNDVSTRYTEALTGFLVTDMIVEYNRVHHMGDADRSTYTGDGISFQNAENCIARYNVVYNVEPQLANTYGMSMFASGNTPPEQIIGIQFYGNLLYRMQMHVDDNDQDVVPEDCVISGNLFCGMAEDAKGGRNDAPLVVELNDSGVLDYELEVSGNNFWRFADGTPGQTTIESGAHMRVYDSPTSSASFDAGTSATNFTGNTALNPKFADTTEAETNGDFTFAADSPFKNFFPADMPLKQSQSQAWTPD